MAMTAFALTFPAITADGLPRSRRAPGVARAASHPHAGGPAAIRTLTAAVLASALLYLPTSAQARDVCQSRACVERVAAKKCSQTRPRQCLLRAALHHRVSYAVLKRKTSCESGFNPYAYNGAPRNRKPTNIIYGGGTAARPNEYEQKSAGLMQFMPTTWNTTPYRSRSIWSAKWNALAGAWMHRVGRGGEWVCR